ncbi:hypothetical protein PSJ8397_01732 [Pseudooctadecabacter jejudonensis]|uniref:Uncharacterized protein n=1 Tax=Pseudooctadecabacter jejudonensis TaxID=1391910 RepID=A0A1Y5SAL3_9RHOB|nr:hypothetical protein PSJ8397_01732 [Pseudooctadecabacter jejudonensis]
MAPVQSSRWQGLEIRLPSLLAAVLTPVLCVFGMEPPRLHDLLLSGTNKKYTSSR